MLSLFQRLSRAPILRVSTIAFLAALISVFRFTPNFLYWRLMEIPLMDRLPPEVARAHFALMQLRHPFLRMENHLARVLEWRLFFPLLGHALSMPPIVYLALPHFGCLWVLIFVVRLVRKHGFDWAESLTATILVATCSWFFVSMGWLAYFDSWYALGLLLFVFAPGLRFAVAAVLIVPWIDERFVITLPLCLVLRWQYLEIFHAPGDRRVDWHAMKLLGLALLPWLLIRLGTMVAGHDSATSGYFRDMITYQFSVKTKYYFLGLWYGVRWAWIFVAVWLVYQWREVQWRMWLLLAFVLALGINLVIAEDISRSVSTLVPVIVAGLLLLKHHWPACLRPILFAACGLNLLFPAEHVAGNSTTPVHYFYAALRNAPPSGDLWFLYYDQRAETLLQIGRREEALYFFDLSIQLNPTHIDIYLNRAIAYARLGRLREARSQADRDVAMNPNGLEALLNRSALRAVSGDSIGALADLDQVLKGASPDWPAQAETMMARERLRAKIAGSH